MCSVVSMLLLTGGLALPANKPSGLTLKQSYTAEQVCEITADVWENFFKVRDLDGNDAITEAELSKYYQSQGQTKEDADQQAKDEFDSAIFYGYFDADGNRVLEKCEYDKMEFTNYGVTPPQCCNPVVHGDPMFKINGKGTHFWLKAGERTPLLTSGAITLSGRTFDRPDTGCPQRLKPRTLNCRSAHICCAHACDPAPPVSRQQPVVRPVHRLQQWQGRARRGHVQWADGRQAGRQGRADRQGATAAPHRALDLI